MEFLIHKDAATHYKLMYHSKEHGMWLNNQDGEGMAITDKQLFDMFDKYFKENV